ncbi:rRNA maturation RNase YbeY [Shimia haliotis]|uniref:Endoribonuclease YbeY n=1 Tax=Shimia haliotis TaxID=1280847 RepID=A0A1I4CJK3_9RHOB|nr:rRNA maturation RNase YbeY [Shimia haliotis]SFK80121.1 probable rRNA maturation factor [Shimia haliotis]
MLTDTLIEDDRWAALDFATLAETAAQAALTHLALDADDWEIAVLACDDSRIAELNTEFRDKPTPTNVLSWPSEERGAEADGDTPHPPQGPDTELGDIAIAFETCEREAEAAGKPMAEHVTHLVVHGVLHLLGYDHIRDKDATLMEGLETAILGKMGFSDPYES